MARGRNSKIDEVEARRLHAEGWTDAQMAERFGVGRNTITSWRINRRLTPLGLEVRALLQEQTNG